MKAAVERAHIDSGALDLCVYSQSMQSSLPANVGRHAWTLAGLSEEPGGYTLNTLCAGALQAMVSAFNKIVGDEYRGILVGGVESHSMAQYYIFHPRYQFGKGNLCFRDQKVEVETRSQPPELYGQVSTAELAGRIALRYGLAREALDSYVVRDHEKALAARPASWGIEPCVVKARKKEITLEGDELPRSLSVADLERQPCIHGSSVVTEAQMAPWADGASSLVMISRQGANELGAAPMGVMRGFAVAAGNPVEPEIITARSMAMVCERCGLSPADIDYYDIHMPSAAYALALEELLGADLSGRINVDGGTIAFGHPGAATGGIMATNLLYRMREKGGRYGLVNVGALGGQSLSILIEGC